MNEVTIISGQDRLDLNDYPAMPIKAYSTVYIGPETLTVVPNEAGQADGRKIQPVLTPRLQRQKLQNSPSANLTDPDLLPL